jgi:hypothetical protein
MREKLRPLAMLVAVSFLLPLCEVVVLRRALEPFDRASLIDAFLMIYAVYWWYVLDRKERNFRTGTFQNMGVILFAPLGLLIYFLRSRGFVKGFAASVVALAIFIGTGVLGHVGEQIGQRIAF